MAREKSEYEKEVEETMKPFTSGAIINWDRVNNMSIDELNMISAMFSKENKNNK